MMKENYEPIVTGFSINIKIPATRPIVIFPDKDIHSWERTFINNKSTAKTLDEHATFEVCRATLKWAATCHATLEKIANVEEGILFNFVFTDAEDMFNFKTYLKVNVEGAIDI